MLNFLFPTYPPRTEYGPEWDPDFGTPLQNGGDNVWSPDNNTPYDNGGDNVWDPDNGQQAWQPSNGTDLWF